MRNKKRVKKIKYLLVILLALTLGYALIATNIKVIGFGNINGMNFDVHWGESKVTAGSVTNTKPEVDGPRTTASFSFNLKKPGDYYEFVIDAVNSGSFDAMITNIDNKVYEADGETVATLPSYIHYTVTYTNGTAIAVNQKLPAKNKKQYKVRVEYDSNTTETPSSILNYVVELKVTYGQANNNAVDVNDGRIKLLDKDIVEISDGQGNDQKYYIIKEEEVNGVDAYVLLAQHNISVFATVPGSVQYLQYDEKAATKKLGVDRLILSGYYITGAERHNEYDCGVFGDYNYIGSGNKEVYETIRYNPSVEYNDECYYHQEESTGVEYCYLRQNYSDDEHYYRFPDGEVYENIGYAPLYGNHTYDNIVLPIERHKEKIKGMGINVLSARALTYDEANTMLDVISKTDEAFWLGTASNASQVYVAYGLNGTSTITEVTVSSVSTEVYIDDYGIAYMGIGIRPVIVVPKSEVLVID